MILHGNAGQAARGCVILLAVLALAVNPGRAAPAPARPDADTGFVRIFDGRTLAGWQASDMSYWSVADGAITGRATLEHPVKTNQFLVWQYGELDDFELKLRFRIAGGPSANSGIQFRSQIAADGHAVGYQADIDRAGRWAGALYDEHARGLLAPRGRKTVVNATGERRQTPLATPEELWQAIRLDDWNDYHITARGSHVVLRINGRVMSELVDDEAAAQDLCGKLALQLHAGPPLTVQFRDIRLRRLPLSDGRRKVVLVAGPPSHDYGSHAHEAQCRLLAGALNAGVPTLLATVYAGGWPRDTSAFDNANAIVLDCDGGAGHVVAPHLAELDALMRRGLGLACLHYALVFPEGEPTRQLQGWLGGAYETWRSVNPTWSAAFTTIPDHPVTRGVEPFSIHDEWYYNMRFAEDMAGVTPLLTAVPPDATRHRPDGPYTGNQHVRAQTGRAEHVAWAFERPGGGRGCGFTGGHSLWNWAHDDCRKLVLNGLAWVAGCEIPAAGVPSRTPTLETLQALLGPPPTGWQPEPVKRLLESWRQGP